MLEDELVYTVVNGVGFKQVGSNVTLRGVNISRLIVTNGQGL